MLDLDKLLATTGMQPVAAYRKGEARSKSKPGSRVNDNSGAHYNVSSADFKDLAGQIRDTLTFLRRNKTWLASLHTLPGVEYITLDFATCPNPEAAVFWNTFPADLLLLAGSLHISLTNSIYPPTEK